MIAFETLEQSESFPTQQSRLDSQSAVIPKHVVVDALENLPCDAILPTDVGYCVVARGFLKQYPTGIEHARFVYCTGGHGYCTFGEHRFSIGPGDLLIVPANVPCEYGTNDVDPWSIYWVETEGALTDTFLHASSTDRQVALRHVGHDLNLVGLFTELTEVVQAGHHSENLFHASNVLRHLMSTLVRRQRESQTPSISSNQRVTASIAFMMRNLARPLDIRQLSQTSKLSPSHYSALFKRQTGYSPLDYFMRLRMQSATELLKHSTVSVKAIAAKLGYKDPLYFSRVFTSVYHMSPTEFRKRKQEGDVGDSPEPNSVTNRSIGPSLPYSPRFAPLPGLELPPQT